MIADYVVLALATGTVFGLVVGLPLGFVLGRTSHTE